jgi:hypothetical protein
LGAFLSGREQVTQLALASNHHRHTRKPGGRNQHQVRVKIKRVRDTNFVPLKVTGKPPTSPQGCDSVQAAAERKFNHIPETIEKWPFALKAAKVNAKTVAIQRPRQCRELTLASASLQAVGHQKNAIAVLRRRRLRSCL